MRAAFMMLITVLALAALQGCGSECEYDGDCGGWGARCVLGWCEYSSGVSEEDLEVGCTGDGELCHAYELGCTYEWDDRKGCLNPKDRGERCEVDADCRAPYVCKDTGLMLVCAYPPLWP